MSESFYDLLKAQTKAVYIKFKKKWLYNINTAQNNPKTRWGWRGWRGGVGGVGGDIAGSKTHRQFSFVWLEMSCLRKHLLFRAVLVTPVPVYHCTGKAISLGIIIAAQ